MIVLYIPSGFDAKFLAQLHLPFPSPPPAMHKLQHSDLYPVFFVNINSLLSKSILRPESPWHFL